MSHKDALKLLFPADLGGVFESDIEIEGEHLDAVQTAAEGLLTESFPANATPDGLLPDWERVCGYKPDVTDPEAERRARVIRKLREQGGLSIPYFETMATERGHAISIDEPQPFRIGKSRVGNDALAIPDIIHCWKATVSVYYIIKFRIGASRMGFTPLGWFDRQDALCAVLRDVKPAHTLVYFRWQLA